MTEKEKTAIAKFVQLEPVGKVSDRAAVPIELRCPKCRQLGTFEILLRGANQGSPIPDVTALNKATISMGSRRCPNRKCGIHVFVIVKHGPQGTEVIRSYPPERVDFDDSSIPEEIRETFDEAVDCHANGDHRAAAIMIRRTVEVLCENKGATGKNLEQRIDNLGTSSGLPKAFTNAMHDIRYLGNDAAHIDAKTYAQVGEGEVRVAIGLVKELLRSIYQLDDLLAGLKALQANGNSE